MQKLSLRTRINQLACVVIGFAATSNNPVLAAGLDKLASTTTNVFDGIDAAAIGVVAIAILVAGIGMALRWVSGQVAGWIVAGSIVAGSALEISTFLFA